MDNLLSYFEKHMIKLVGIPFIANLALALADGHISADEYHSLVNGARFSELLILGLVMGLLKLRGK